MWTPPWLHLVHETLEPLPPRSLPTWRAWQQHAHSDELVLVAHSIYKVRTIKQFHFYRQGSLINCLQAGIKKLRSQGSWSNKLEDSFKQLNCAPALWPNRYRIFGDLSYLWRWEHWKHQIVDSEFLCWENKLSWKYFHSPVGKSRHERLILFQVSSNSHWCV